MKKLVLLFVMIFTIISSYAAGIEAGMKLYFTPNSGWKSAEARFAAYFFDDYSGTAWASLTLVSGETDLYEVTVPGVKEDGTPKEGTWDKVIFCRMNPNNSDNNFVKDGEPHYGPFWDKTADLSFDGTNDWFQMTECASWCDDGSWTSQGSGYTGPGIEAGTELYFSPNSYWNADGARFAAYFFDQFGGQAWVDLTPVSGETDLYEVTVPATLTDGTPKEGTWDGVIFCRMDPNNPQNNFDEGENASFWNKTADLSYDGTNNWFQMTECADWCSEGTWTFFEAITEPVIYFSLPPKAFLDESIELSATSKNVDNPVYTYLVKTPGETSFQPVTSPYQPTEYGVHEFKAQVAENAAPGNILDEKTVSVSVIPPLDPITVSIKRPRNWINVWLYNWGDGIEGNFKEASRVGDWYTYTFTHVESVNIIFVDMDEEGVWPEDTDPAVKLGRQTVDVLNVTESTCYEAGDADYTDGNPDWGKRTVNVVDCDVNATVQATDDKVSVFAGTGTINALFDGFATIQLYSVNGVLLKKTTAVDSFEQTGLTSGLYIVKINGKATKLVVK